MGEKIVGRICSYSGMYNSSDQATIKRTSQSIIKVSKNCEGISQMYLTNCRTAICYTNDDNAVRL